MDEVFRPYLLCSENIEGAEEIFLEKFFSVVKLPPFSALSDVVSSHADTLICPIGDTIAVHGDYLEQNAELFEKRGIKTKKISESAGKKYPDDILLGGLFLSEKLYGRLDKLSKTLLDATENSAFVRQGYTRCSVCKLSENAIITADIGVANAVRQDGIDALVISPGHILLKGCDYGFIGGASFTYKNTVYFFGRAEDHPDFQRMSDFAKKHSVDLVSLSENPLYDIGGAVIYEKN